GDLDIRGKLVINGRGSGATVIDGNNLDRVFQILAGKVAISGVTIQHGRAAIGGGLLNSGGQVALASVSLLNNLAQGGDGKAGGDGNSLAGGSGGAGGGGATNGDTGAKGAIGEGGGGGGGGSAAGGAIYNAAGSLAISASLIASNQAIGGSGGAGGAGATVF